MLIRKLSIAIVLVLTLFLSSCSSVMDTKIYCNYNWKSSCIYVADVVVFGTWGGGTIATWYYYGFWAGAGFALVLGPMIPLVIFPMLVCVFDDNCDITKGY
jgi:hypothetical protein